MAQKLTAYGIIGDGHVARHMTNYFGLLGLSHLTWSRKLAAEARMPLQSLIEECETILLLIRDDAIDPFIAQHPELRSRRLVHFSGSHYTEQAQGFHPLMGFSAKLYELPVYRSMSFIVDEDAEAFEDVFPLLPNPHYRIAKELKPLYHALCVVAGNSSMLIWQQTMQQFKEKLGLPVEALAPIMRQLTELTIANPHDCLTGPIVRKEAATVEKNLAALSGTPMHATYLRLLKELWPERYAVPFSETRHEI